jgi:hypothetical protein
MSGRTVLACPDDILGCVVLRAENGHQQRLRAGGLPAYLAGCRRGGKQFLVATTLFGRTIVYDGEGAEVRTFDDSDPTCAPAVAAAGKDVLLAVLSGEKIAVHNALTGRPIAERTIAAARPRALAFATLAGKPVLAQALNDGTYILSDPHTMTKVAELPTPRGGIRAAAADGSMLFTAGDDGLHAITLR